MEKVLHTKMPYMGLFKVVTMVLSKLSKIEN